MKGLHKNSLRKGEPNKWMIDDARMELIQQIKAEVERLKEENNNIRCDSNKAYCQGYGDAFVDLLSVLSDLESEKPTIQEQTVCEDVSREEVIGLSIMAYLETHIKKDKGLVLRGVTLNDAREWIRRQIAKQGEPVCEELEEEIDRFENWMETYNQVDYPTSFTTRDIARHFAQWQKEKDTRDMCMSDNRHFQKVYELGKKDMKEQMMKEAVEGYVAQRVHGNLYAKCRVPESMNLHFGDKVKLIICKED